MRIPPSVHRFLFPILSAAVVGASLFLMLRLYIPKASVLWDESVYIRGVYDTYTAMAAGNWDTVWRLSRAVLREPALQYWVLGAILQPFRFSIQSVRTAGLVWFVLTALATYLYAYRAARHRPHLVGFIAVLLTAVSPMMLFFGSTETKEMMGAALTVGVTLLYFRAASLGTVHRIGISLLLFVVTMGKLNYGILLAGLIGINELIELAVTRSLRPAAARIAALFIPYATLMAGWLVYPVNQLPLFLKIMANANISYTTQFPDPLDYYLFYPSSIVHVYAPSIVVGVMILVSLILGTRYMRQPMMRFAVLAVWINIASGIQHSNFVLDRFILTVMPFAFVVASVVWTDLVSRAAGLTRRQERILAALALAGVVLVARDMIRLPSYVYDVAAFTDLSPVFSQPKIPPALWPHWKVDMTTHIPAGDYHTPLSVYADIAANVDLSKPTVILGEANEFSPYLRDLMIELYVKNGTYRHDTTYSSYIAVIEILPTSAYYTRDYIIINEPKIAALPAIKADPSYTQLKRIDYPDMDIVLWIFAKP